MGRLGLADSCSDPNDKHTEQNEGNDTSDGQYKDCDPGSDLAYQWERCRI